MEESHCRVAKNIVKEAKNRAELFGLLSFLDERLPNDAEVHSMILATLCTTNPSYRVFFTRESDGDGNNYLAIVAIKAQLTNTPTRQANEKLWILSGWGIDETTISTVFSAIDNVDWSTDGFIISYNGYTISPDIFGMTIGRMLYKEEYKEMGRYVMDISEALNQQLTFPETVYVKSLERCHAKIVYDHWRYNYTTSLEDVADEISECPSAGLFLKATDQLISWIMYNPPNGMSRLHTLSEYRRLGYAALVIRYMSKRMAQAGHVPFVNIVKENINSRQLFEKLGFKFIHFTNQLFLLSPR